MTNSSRNFLLMTLTTLCPLLALAQTPPPKPAAPPPPRPVIVTTPSPSQQWQRQVDRQQLQNQQNQNAVREQLRQGNLDRQRANTTNPALQNQLDAADRSQQQLYRARQEDAVKRYQSLPANEPATQTRRIEPAPARGSSAGR